MGVLDDAIREHLELKRRHGAAEEELRQQEAEALGPARREAPASDATQAVDAEEAPEQALPEAEPSADAAPPHGDPLGEEALPHAPHAEQAQTGPHPDLEAPAHAAPEPASADPTELSPEPDEVPAEEALEAPTQRGVTPSAGFDAVTADEPAPAEPEVAEPPAEDDEGEDVLEETPDFLQDAPEHDRLWFEQKPPRDFDFDE